MSLPDDVCWRTSLSSDQRRCPSIYDRPAVTAVALSTVAQARPRPSGTAEMAAALEHVTPVAQGFIRAPLGPVAKKALGRAPPATAPRGTVSLPARCDTAPSTARAGDRHCVHRQNFDKGSTRPHTRAHRPRCRRAASRAKEGTRGGRRGPPGPWRQSQASSSEHTAKTTIAGGAPPSQVAPSEFPSEHGWASRPVSRPEGRTRGEHQRPLFPARRVGVSSVVHGLR
jgi:hypothetical protein